MSAWFTPEQSNMVGAIAGAVIGGVGGGGTGVLVGTLASRGKAKAFVASFMGFWIAVGLILLIAAGCAAIDGQPAHVWRPLLLNGFVPTVVLGSLLPMTLQRYRQAERRKLEAEEFRRG